MYIEEQLDKLKKDYRVLEGDYQLLRNNSEADKRMYEAEVDNIKRKC